MRRGGERERERELKAYFDILTQREKEDDKEKMNSLSGIRTPVFHVTGEDT